MKIIVEGIKGVGKTTMINRLSKMFGLQIFHCTNKTNNNLEMFNSMLETDNWIMDRGPYGQFVYGDEHLQIGSLSELRKLENKLIAKGVIVVWMTPKQPKFIGYDNDVYHEIVDTCRNDCNPKDLRKEDEMFKRIFEEESLIIPKVIEVDIFRNSKEGL